MVELGEGDFAELCRAGPVSAEIGSIEHNRREAVKRFWLYLIGGIAASGAIGALLIGAGWTMTGYFLAIIGLILTVVLAMGPLDSASKALKQPALEAIAERGGMSYAAAGFAPPVYAAARPALFGNWLSSQNFTDLFHGTDAEGRRFAVYEGTLTRKQGRYTQTVFSGQLHAFERRGGGGSEIVIVPDRGLFNFFKPVSGMERVRFENDPEFERRFEVYAFQPHEALMLIGSDARRKLVELSQAGRVFGYVGPTEVLVAVTGRNRFEAGSMFRSIDGQARVRAMFDEVCHSLGQLRALRAVLG